jgi:hypothetical protein
VGQRWLRASRGDQSGRLAVGPRLLLVLPDATVVVAVVVVVVQHG